MIRKQNAYLHAICLVTNQVSQVSTLAMPQPPIIFYLQGNDIQSHDVSSVHPMQHTMLQINKYKSNLEYDL